MLVESVPCLQDPWDTYFWKLPVFPAPYTLWHPGSQNYAPVEGSGRHKTVALTGPGLLSGSVFYQGIPFGSRTCHNLWRQGYGMDLSPSDWVAPGSSL